MKNDKIKKSTKPQPVLNYDYFLQAFREKQEMRREKNEELLKTFESEAKEIAKQIYNDLLTRFIEGNDPWIVDDSLKLEVFSFNDKQSDDMAEEKLSIIQNILYEEYFDSQRLFSAVIDYEKDIRALFIIKKSEASINVASLQKSNLIVEYFKLICATANERQRLRKINASGFKKEVLSATTAIIEKLEKAVLEKKNIFLDETNNVFEKGKTFMIEVSNKKVAEMVKNNIKKKHYWIPLDYDRSKLDTEKTKMYILENLFNE